MKKISAIGFAALVFATNAVATFMEHETVTVECRWVVDLHTTSIHRTPQDGYTISVPRCEPVGLRTRSDLDKKMSDFMESETVTVECRWVVDLRTTFIHGIPQDGYTISEPSCVPVGLELRARWSSDTIRPRQEDVR